MQKAIVLVEDCVHVALEGFFGGRAASIQRFVHGVLRCFFCALSPRSVLADGGLLCEYARAQRCKILQRNIMKKYDWGGERPWILKDTIHDVRTKVKLLPPPYRTKQVPSWPHSLSSLSKG